jgi:Sec-independent protein secretion pathway component TatC
LALAVPLLLFYELSIMIGRVIERKREAEDKKAEAEELKAEEAEKEAEKKAEEDKKAGDAAGGAAS